MPFNRLTRRAAGADRHAGVYVQLDELLRYEAKAVGFSFLPRQPIHSLLAGKHTSRLRGRGLNFDEIRRYVAGDDVRNIDWKVTARTRKPHIRVYTEERDRPVLLLVDQRVNMFFGSARCMKSVQAAELAALAAWRTFGVGDRVGALLYNDREVVEIKPQRGRERVARILGEVTRLNQQLHAEDQAASNPEMFDEVLRLAGRLVGHDALVVLIGDGTGAGEMSVRLVSRLTEHNDVIAVYVYDPLEADLPDHGRYMLARDVEQLLIEPARARLGVRFRESFEQRLAWLRKVSRNREIPLLPITTAEDATSQVQRALGYAGGR